MNLLQLTNKIKEAADLHPLVNQVADGSIYEALNTGDVRYPISVVFSQSVVKEVRTIRYKYVLYFVDRLVGDNALEIQTTAISVIQQIINTIGNNVENISIATGYSIQPFTEKFADECAGAFVQFDIVSENVLGNCSYDEGGDQPILDSYVRKDEVKQSVIEGETLPISSGAVFTALQGISVDVEAVDVSYDNTTSGIISDNVQGAIDEVKVAIDTIELNNQSVSATGAPLYQSNEDSDVLGYKKIKSTPDALETILPPITLTSTEQLIRTYLFDLPINTTTISAGNWLGSVIGKISNASGTSKLRVEAFLRHADGTETTLFSKESNEINNTDYATISMDFAGDVYSCLTTDRLGFRVYGVTSGANRTLTTKIGNGNLSFFSTPLSIRHDQTRDKNGNPDFLHITQAEKDDFGIKAYAYELVNVAPTIALKLATQTAIIETLTSANTLAITLPTPRLNKVNESIITFKIDQSLPDITFPMVAGWNTEEFVLSVDRTRTIVFQQITFDGVNWETWASCDRNS